MLSKLRKLPTGMLFKKGRYAMKLCILSMQKVPNFGSKLQSYALKQMLIELGCEVQFLDIVPDAREDILKGEAAKQIEAIGKQVAIAKKLKRLDRYAVNRIHIKCRARMQNKKYKAFCREYLTAAPKDARFDCCVIGSDEVFNCMADTPWGFTSQLFGNVPQADKVITYAACCGETTYQKLPGPVADRIRQAFQRISAFSVRDENTVDFVAKLTESQVTHHFDPVIVANFDQEINKATLPAGLPEKYCLVYSYYNRIEDTERIRDIKKFCKAKGLKLVTLGAPQMWIRNHLVADPFQALKVFQNAAFVITDTFHGTIFSAKYAKRFAVMVCDSNHNKLSDLVKRLGLENHLMANTDQLDRAFAGENDLTQMAAMSARERKRSMEYLSRALHHYENPASGVKS